MIPSVSEELLIYAMGLRDNFHILLDAKWYHTDKCRVGSSDGGHQQHLRASHLGSLVTDSQDGLTSHRYTADASGGGEIREAAIKFFAHMFGVECLQNYVRLDPLLYLFLTRPLFFCYSQGWKYIVFRAPDVGFWGQNER